MPKVLREGPEFSTPRPEPQVIKEDIGQVEKTIDVPTLSNPKGDIAENAPTIEPIMEPIEDPSLVPSNPVEQKPNVALESTEPTEPILAAGSESPKAEAISPLQIPVQEVTNIGSNQLDEVPKTSPSQAQL